MGLYFLALLAFIIGAVWILVDAQRPSAPSVFLEIKAEQIPGTSNRGNVYLLSEQTGTILQVGRFKVEQGEAILTLRMPENQFSDKDRWEAQFWQSAYSSYRPYAQFIHDDRLQNRLSEIVSRAFDNPRLQKRAENFGKEVFEELFNKVQPYFREITDDPQFRSLIIDVGLEEGTRLLPRGKRLELERTWVEPMTDLVLLKARKWPWNEWIEEIVSDSEKQDEFMAMVNELEPFFREALQNFLWNQEHELRPGPEYAPNVRLLWVARRTLFGAREPAITLMRGAKGQTLNEATTLKLREVR